ncbi:ClpP class serine protease [Thalassospira sp. 11-3]|nr:ClpP class serine protease [Thalassospira sp. 11-3]
MINWGLLREVVGATPWCVDFHTLPALLSVMDNIQNGVQFTVADNGEKYNTPLLMRVGNDTRIINRPYGNGWEPGQLENNEKFKAVGIININGPITTSGGASSRGMDHVSSIMRKMAADERVVSFIVLADSGGGASAAVEIMTNTINQVKETKPVYGLVKKGGMAASAMYGILSACNEIYAEDEMAIVGSCGTMIQFNGREANTTDPDGVKHIRMYATKSTMKNKGFEDALNKDNYTVILNELLNPINERFLDHLLANRPQLKGTDFDNGNTKFAKDSVGTYVDGIKSFSEVFQMAAKAGKDKPGFKAGGPTSNNNLIKGNMDINELKQNHPATYNSIFNAGVSAERDRAGSWLAHANTDMETVINGIKSGNEISATVREELLVKANANAQLGKLESDSAGAIATKEEKTKVDQLDNDDEVEAFYKDVDSKLGLNAKTV